MLCQRPSPPLLQVGEDTPKNKRSLAKICARTTGERSSDERGGCGVLGVAEKISSWKKVETLRKCTLYPALLHCCKVTRYAQPVDACSWNSRAQWQTCVGLKHFKQLRRGFCDPETSPQTRPFWTFVQAWWLRCCVTSLIRSHTILRVSFLYCSY